LGAQRLQRKIRDECRDIDDAATAEGQAGALRAGGSETYQFQETLLGRGQAGRADGFELFVGEDEFLVPERLGLGRLAARDLVNEVVDFAADLVELGAVQ